MTLAIGISVSRIHQILAKFYSSANLLLVLVGEFSSCIRLLLMIIGELSDIHSLLLSETSPHEATFILHLPTTYFCWSYPV